MKDTSFRIQDDPSVVRRLIRDLDIWSVSLFLLSILILIVQAVLKKADLLGRSSRSKYLNSTEEVVYNLRPV
jgi:hypothetical protein